MKKIVFTFFMVLLMVFCMAMMALSFVLAIKWSGGIIGFLLEVVLGFLIIIAGLITGLIVIFIRDLFRALKKYKREMRAWKNAKIKNND